MAGVFYGLTAVLLAVLLASQPTLLPLLGSATVWATAVTAVLGWLCAQQALVLARLLAPVTALITSVDPVEVDPWHRTLTVWGQ